MPQRHGMRPLELLELVGERAIRLLAVRDREPGLPHARVDAEHRLDARRPPLAEHRAAVEAVRADALPRQAALVARAERRDAEHPRDLGRDADRGELPAVAADLVHAEGRDDLLHSLAERLDEVRQRVGIAERERVLEQEVRVHRVGAEREGDHEVVKVAQAARGHDERALAPQRPVARRLRDERAVRRGDDEKRIEPRATFLDGVAVLHEHERRAAAHAAAGLRTEARERVARMLLPVAVRLEDHRHALAVGGELRDDVLDDPRPELVARARGDPRRAARSPARDRRGGSACCSSTQRPRSREARRRGARRRTRTEQSARREVLDLALAVDRGIGHDGDGLVQVVREIRARGGQRRERSVPAERADRLVRRSAPRTAPS